MPKTISTIAEITGVYIEQLGKASPAILLAAGAAVLIALGWRFYFDRQGDQETKTARLLSLGLLGLAVAWGLWQAIGQASLVDDAFISFRYARNWAEGLGVVWNAGERVEGYTNFLWVAITALILRFTPWAAPEIGLVLCLLCLIANLIAVGLLGKRLQGSGPYLPVTAPLLAASWVFTSFGTTGMETMAVSLLVNLGALSLVARDDAKGAFFAGLFLILATFTRPDHSLFYLAGGLALLLDAARRCLLTKVISPAAALKIACAYGLPFIAYLGYLGWKFFYYGSILPNTYFAKSADQTYFDQGLIYAATFYLGSHFWLYAALFLVWLVLPVKSAGALRLKLFGAIGFFAFNLYVLKVGGDFMYGRFYLTLLPLALLGAEGIFYFLAEGKTKKSAMVLTLVAALLGASAVSLHLIKPNSIRWNQSDEGSVYRLKSIFPPVVRHPNFRIGKLFGSALADRDLKPVIATTGIGMIGYYSRLPVIDLRGLTDPVIARQKVTRRGRPGHEKKAEQDYLIERGVHFVRSKIHKKHSHLTTLKLGRKMGRAWQILVYDRELMREIKKTAPEIGFIDFENHLDLYTAKLDRFKIAPDAGELEFFRRYYFEHNDDRVRLDRLTVLTEEEF